MTRTRKEARDATAIAERLTLLADQLQCASAELTTMVKDLRVQSDKDLEGLQQEIDDERSKSD